MASIDLSFVTDLLVLNNGPQVLPAAPTIYGRSKGQSLLIEAYTRLVGENHAQTVIIHGESGSGKTALADQLRNQVFDANGYFVAGKYVQNAAVQEPHSAIMAAFSDLCDLVAQQSSNEICRRQEIAEGLKSEAHLLVRAISNLSPLLGGNVREVETDIFSTAQFRVACRTFLRVMASNEHPVVVFLDDIQWADHGSIQLIQMFLRDAELKHVMFILAYRDEDAKEVQESGILAITERENQLTDIALSNLSAGAVHELVVSLLGPGVNEQQSKQLSTLVAKRTGGNPLHILTFMEMIDDDGLLTFDGGQAAFVFDADIIQRETMVSETLADLLIRKVERLTEDMKETLKIASLVGYDFEADILVKVASIVIEEKRKDMGSDVSVSATSPNESAISSLSNALKEGFVEKTSRWLQFTHDKLQSVFRSMISESEEDHLHMLIGQAFLTDRLEGASYIYKAAAHLNCAPSYLHDLNRQQRVELAHISLDAARYCKSISAFGEAAVVLRNGIFILGHLDQWNREHFALKSEILESLAKAQLVVGDFGACKETTREALRFNRTPEMIINIQLIDVEVHMAENAVDDALTAANRVLCDLGVKIPRTPNMRHILAKLVQVKWLLKNRQDDDILNLPPTCDPPSATAVKLLMHVCSYCLLKSEKNTAIFSALAAAELTLKKGWSKYSSGAFAIYGMVEASLGYIDRGYRFGKLALKMLERSESREAECCTVCLALTLISFHREKLEALVRPLYHAARLGYQYGDVVYSTYCLSQCFSMHVSLGTNINSIENAMQESYATVSELGQDALLLWLQPTFQLVLNLKEDVTNFDNIAVLTGNIMDEENYFGQALESNHEVLMTMALLLKAHLAIQFGQFSLAATLYLQCQLFGFDTVRFSYVASPVYWNVARSNYCLFEISGRRQHLRTARKYKRKIQRLDASGSPEASRRYAYLVAQETAVVRKKSVDNVAVRNAYRRGIDFMVRDNASHLEGLLNEKAGFDFTKRGMREDAEQCFNRALHVHETEWGAIAKYNWLKQCSDIALSQLPTPDNDPTTRTLWGTYVNVPVFNEGS